VKDRKSPKELEPDDQIVIYYDEERNLYHYASWSVYAAPSWRRVVGRIVETEELEGTSTESEMVEKNGQVVFMMGREKAWKVRFFIGESRYTQELPGNFMFEVLPKHHPVCIECVEPWPCREHRQEAAGQRLMWELADTCYHCGRRINGAWSTSFTVDGSQRKYHTAKKYRGSDGRRCGDVGRAAHIAQRSKAEPTHHSGSFPDGTA
jgi:hypothetical protein